MDGETQKESNGWDNTKVIKWMGKCKENRMDVKTQRNQVDEELQRESNG